jgi:hypothetical protein
MRPFLISLCLAAAATLPSCRHAASPDESETSPVGPTVLSENALRSALTGPVSFGNHIKPILEANCLPCHDGREMPAFLNLSSRQTAFASGPYGPRIVPGKPAETSAPSTHPSKPCPRSVTASPPTNAASSRNGSPKVPSGPAARPVSCANQRTESRAPRPAAVPRGNPDAQSR